MSSIFLEREGSLPIVFIGGYYGSGKTFLIESLVRASPSDCKLAVLLCDAPGGDSSEPSFDYHALFLSLSRELVSSRLLLTTCPSRADRISALLTSLASDPAVACILVELPAEVPLASFAEVASATPALSSVAHVSALVACVACTSSPLALAADARRAPALARAELCLGKVTDVVLTRAPGEGERDALKRACVSRAPTARVAFADDRGLATQLLHRQRRLPSSSSSASSSSASASSSSSSSSPSKEDLTLLSRVPFFARRPLDPARLSAIFARLPGLQRVRLPYAKGLLWLATRQRAGLWAHHGPEPPGVAKGPEWLCARGEALRPPGWRTFADTRGDDRCVRVELFVARQDPESAEAVRKLLEMALCEDGDECSDPLPPWEGGRVEKRGAGTAWATAAPQAPRRADLRQSMENSTSAASSSRATSSSLSSSSSWNSTSDPAEVIEASLQSLLQDALQRVLEDTRKLVRFLEAAREGVELFSEADVLALARESAGATARLVSLATDPQASDAPLRALAREVQVAVLMLIRGCRDGVDGDDDDGGEGEGGSRLAELREHVVEACAAFERRMEELVRQEEELDCCEAAVEELAGVAALMQEMRAAVAQGARAAFLSASRRMARHVSGVRKLALPPGTFDIESRLLKDSLMRLLEACRGQTHGIVEGRAGAEEPEFAAAMNAMRSVVQRFRQLLEQYLQRAAEDGGDEDDDDDGGGGGGEGIGGMATARRNKAKKKKGGADIAEVGRKDSSPSSISSWQQGSSSSPQKAGGGASSPLSAVPATRRRRDSNAAEAEGVLLQSRGAATAVAAARLERRRTKHRSLELVDGAELDSSSSSSPSSSLAEGGGAASPAPVVPQSAVLASMAKMESRAANASGGSLTRSTTSQVKRKSRRSKAPPAEALATPAAPPGRGGGGGGGAAAAAEAAAAEGQEAEDQKKKAPPAAPVDATSAAPPEGVMPKRSRKKSIRQKRVLDKPPPRPVKPSTKPAGAVSAAAGSHRNSFRGGGGGSPQSTMGMSGGAAAASTLAGLEELQEREIQQAMLTFSTWRAEALKKATSKKLQRRTRQFGVPGDLVRLAPMERARALATELDDGVLDFTVCANEHALNPTSPSDLAAATEMVFELARVFAVAVRDACVETAASGGAGQLPASCAVMQEFVERLGKARRQGEALQTTLDAAHGPAVTQVERLLQVEVYRDSNAVIQLACVLLAALAELLSQLARKKVDMDALRSEMLYAGAGVAKLAQRMSALLDLVATSKAVARERERRRQRGGSTDEASGSLCVRGESFWKSARGKLAFEKECGGDLSGLLGGTLNELVELLTSDTAYDNRFLKSFLTTYRSFTTPWILFEKLVERYEIPKGCIDEARHKSIKLRVCVVLKYWVENQFHDFDEDLISQIFEFVDQRMQVDMGSIASVLSQEIRNKMSKRSTLQFITPSQSGLRATEVAHTLPAQLLSESREADIAAQMTLVAWRTYVSIEPQELLNQAWNKDKLKHRAPNVIALIDMVNSTSYWVAGVVLMQEKAAARKKLYQKFVLVAEELRKLNNYHLLMGVIAGLSMSSITRMSQLHSAAGSKYQKTLARLEDLMHPQGSFKAYREALHSSKPPCIPYMGVYLTDLTFLEDGNEDFLDADRCVVNFKKREMVYRVIEETLQYKVSPYNFEKQEPLFDVLSELPHFSEKELYNLSIIREPRKVK